MTKESVEEYYGAELVKELGEIGDEALAALTDPVVLKNKVVYEDFNQTPAPTPSLRNLVHQPGNNDS